MKGNGISNPAFIDNDGDFQSDMNGNTKPDPQEDFNNSKLPNGTHKTIDDSDPRENWGTGLEFLMSCIAMSVGLGNVWRFPFTALDNGGGAFLIPYIIVLILVGRPIYYMEMIIGQFSSRGSIKVYALAPAMKGIGYGQIVAITFLATFYSSLMAIIGRYLIASFFNPLPWSQCHEDWKNCIDATGTISNSPSDNASLTSSAEFWFLRDVLKEFDTIDYGIGTPDWKLTISLIISWLCIMLVLIKGVRSSGKAAYFLAIFPYVILTILFVQALILPGSGKGILFFITPQWDQLLNPQVWYAAITQCFFSLAVCFGNIIMYASYNRFDHNIYRDVNIVTTLDTFTSLLAGCTIFGVLGHLAHEMGTDDIAAVVQGGPGLAFISYPDAIARFGWSPQLFGVLFFFMLFILGIGSNIAMASTTITAVRDSFPRVKPWHGAVGFAIFGCSISLVYITEGGQYILNLVDYFGVSMVAYVVAIAQLVTLSWIYGVNRLCKDVEFMLGRKTGYFWRLCWGIITPAIMIVVLIYSYISYVPITYKDRRYPDSVYAVGWLLLVLGVSQVPIWIVIGIIKQDGNTLKEKIHKAFTPISNWGPLKADNLKNYQLFMEDYNNKVKNRGKQGFFARARRTLRL